MSVMRIIAMLLLSSELQLVTATCGDFPIRRDAVLNTWHSSSGFGQSCFHSRSEQEQKQKATTYGGSQFIHSEKVDHSIDGFHWFAVQLNEPVLIRSVTVMGRGDSVTQDIYKRGTDIEIWTSSSNGPIFSGDHCRAMDISKQFNKTRDMWKLCGVTKSKLVNNIVAGEIFTVGCLAQVQHLMLRRNVMGKRSFDDQFMSIADLRLQTTDIGINAPDVVPLDSSFTVSCSLHCNGTGLSTDSTSLQLCLPNGSCTGQHKMEIVSANPQHSGNYKCKMDSVEHSTTVTVLSSNSPSTVPLDSSFTVSCSLHCNGTDLSTDSTSLQLCLPNSTCTGQHKMEIVSAKPQHSGNYKCKMDSVEHSTTVTVLSTIASAFVVAENSSFTVSCALYYNETMMCDKVKLCNGMQICDATGECKTNSGELVIQSAMRENSGSYMYACKFNGIEHRIAVSVLYPLSRLSITIINNGSCTNTSELTITFASAASNPAAEHRCSTADMNLHMLSSPQSNAQNESVSRWSFGVDEAQQTQGWINGSIECMQNEHRIRAAWSCKSSQSKDKLAASIIPGVGSTVLVAIFICVIVIVVTRLKKRRSIEPIRKANARPTPTELNVAPAGRELSALSESCTYATVEDDAPEPIYVDGAYFDASRC